MKLCLRGLLGVFCFFSFLTFSFGQNNLVEPGEVFDDAEVAKIYLTVSESDLNDLLDLSNFSKDKLYPATFRFVNGNVDEIVENVGIRLRGNTSLTSAKKSIKISFNSFEPDRQWRGLEKMNINGEHNDPSIARSKVVWDMARKMGISGTRANHVELFVNDDYVGLYLHIEHIDEHYIQSRFNNDQGNLYKCIYGSDLKWRGSNPDNYKQEQSGKRVYELKNNNKADDYSDLVDLIDVLNNTSDADFSCELEKVFNVEDWLKYLALHILSGHWDDAILNKNNYYLYHNLATGKFEYLLYDLDNTLGVDFLGNDLANRDITDWGRSSINHPLYFRVTAVPEYQDRLYQILEQAVDDFYNADFYTPYLNSMRSKLSSSVEDDPFHGQDYGFTFSDWENSFDNPLNYFHVEKSILDFIVTRGNTIKAQLPNYSTVPGFNYPKLDYEKGYNNYPVYIQVEDKELIEVKICLTAPGQADEVCFDLLDDGIGDDETAGDQRYSGNISTAESGAHTFYFSATDSDGNSGSYPRCGTGKIYVEVNPNKIVINEFVASNENGPQDEAEELEDWVEIYNPFTSFKTLANLYLSDNFDIPAKYRFPNKTLAPKTYQIVWADNDEEQGEWHAKFKLSSAGEKLMLFQENQGLFTLIDYIDYDGVDPDEAIARLPNGYGNFKTANPSPLASNNTTGIEELPAPEALTIYPNPNFGDQIFITTPTTIDLALPVNCTIYHSNGQAVFSKQFDHFPKMLNLEQTDQWASGVYLLQISGAGFQIQEKFNKP